MTWSQTWSHEKRTVEISTVLRIYRLFPLFFGVLLWLIYALNIIPNSNIAHLFPLIISFIKIFVAENVAKSPVG